MNKIYNFEDYSAPIPEGFVHCYPLRTHTYLVECTHEYCGDCTACDPDLFTCIGHKNCYNYTPEDRAYAITKKLNPKVVTYCKHRKGEKALNLPFYERRTIMNKIYNFEDYSAPSLSEQVADVELPWEDPHLICGATGKSCYMGMYCNCLCCKFEFVSHARRINNRDYITRPLDPRIVTYCKHRKGEKALNLPF